MYQSWSWTLELSPPKPWTPQVTTVQSARIAAKANHAPHIFWTFLSWSWTGAVTTMARIAPGHYGSIFQNYIELQQKHLPCHRPAGHSWVDAGSVTTIVLIAPCHNASMRQNGSKSAGRATDLLDIPELILDARAVTTIVLIAPCHQLSPRFYVPQWQQKHRPCHRSAEHSWADLGLWSCHHHGPDCPRSLRLHLPELQQKHLPCHRSAGHSWAGRWSCRHHSLACPMSQRFHVAKAPAVPQICWTFLSWSWTLELSPP